MSFVRVSNAYLFWKRHPALLAGAFFFLGTLFSLSHSFAVIFGACILISSSYRLIHWAALSFLLGFLYSTCSVQLPSNNSVIEGRGHAEIIDVISFSEHNKAVWKLILVMKDFENKASNVVVNSFWRKANRPKAGFIYAVEGTLETTDTGAVFRTKQKTAWKPVATTFSFTEMRVALRQKAICFFRKYFPPGEVRNFLEGISTGQIQDKILSEQLRFFGLSHIIVVSGFHFSILTCFFMLFLRLFFSWRVSNIALLFVVFGYLCFIGPAPSVARAFISVFTLILGRCIEKTGSGLNSLGLAACVLLLYNPVWALHLGFCLSFLATFAILLLFSPLQHIVDRLFPKRTLPEVVALSFYDKLCHIVLSFVRGACILSVAVHVMMLPLILFLFGSFPLFGFVYNIFFPVCTSLSMVFLYIGFITSFIPYLCPLVLSLSYFLAEWALSFVLYAPEVMTYGVMHCEINPYFFAAIQSTLVFGGIYLYNKTHIEAKSELFAYI